MVTDDDEDDDNGNGNDIYKDKPYLIVYSIIGCFSFVSEFHEKNE